MAVLWLTGRAFNREEANSPKLARVKKKKIKKAIIGTVCHSHGGEYREHVVEGALVRDQNWSPLPEYETLYQ